MPVRSFSIVLISTQLKRDTEIDALKKLVRRLQEQQYESERAPLKKRHSIVSQATQSSPALIGGRESNAAARDTDHDYESEIAGLRAELTKTRKDFDASNKNWESRFNVLRASLHEIKDESFLRKRIEHQPLAIHTASYPNQSNKSSYGCHNLI